MFNCFFCKKYSFLGTRQQTILFGKSKYNVGALAQAIVLDVGGGSSIRLAGQQLPLSTGKDPHLVGYRN